jgi:tRNA modification GTPase
LSRAVLEIRSDLLDLLADVEAGLDFSHEDLECVEPAEIHRRLRLARGRLADVRSKCSSRRIDARPPRVVLVGPPNAGKSSLFNALAGAPRAIAHDAPGTTRDVVSAIATIEGRRIEILDTAGAAENPDEILRSAERLREREAHDAHLLVVCRPADEPASNPPPSSSKTPAIIVRTKSDLAVEEGDPGFDASVSIFNPDSIENLARLLSNRLAARRTEDGPGGVASERVAASLDLAACALDAAGRILNEGVGDEFLADAIRDAVQHLGEIVGEACTEDLLDRVFSRFCIGK